MTRTGTLRMALGLTAVLGIMLQASAQEVKKSTIRGAGLGALLGQAIGNDTESTLIGGAIGAGVGHVVGSNKKEKAQTTTTTAPAPPPPAPAPKPEPKAAEPKPEAAEPPKNEEAEAETDPAEALYGNYWRVKSVSPKDRVPPFFSKVVLFLRDGYVQTLTTSPEGESTLSEESFSSVGDTLVIKKADDVVQARFKVDGDDLIISGDDFSAVLTRVQPE